MTLSNGKEMLGRQLQDIGFYSLSDDRAKQCSALSPLWRCELLLTDRCNFACPYCRGMRDDLRGILSWDDAYHVVDMWMSEGLRNVRFSGGEPTLWPYLTYLCSRCRDGGVERIAVSTNGSADEVVYQSLLDAGVNDFSISLDACCASVGDKMAGGKHGAWRRAVDSIRFLSASTYTTVGMVFTEDNWESAADSVLFADSLGVSDIRVVPSAQFSKVLTQLAELPSAVLEKYPILRYRIANVLRRRNVRSMCADDCGKCSLALDDMAVAGDKHFPCIIYLREGGAPIGTVGPNMRVERERWVASHNSHSDPICRAMCLDVCIDYNNKVRDLSLQNAQRDRHGTPRSVPANCSARGCE